MPMPLDELRQSAHTAGRAQIAYVGPPQLSDESTPPSPRAAAGRSEREALLAGDRAVPIAPPDVPVPLDLNIHDLLSLVASEYDKMAAECQVLRSGDCQKLSYGPQSGFDVRLPPPPWTDPSSATTAHGHCNGTLSKVSEEKICEIDSPKLSHKDNQDSPAELYSSEGSKRGSWGNTHIRSVAKKLTNSEPGRGKLGDNGSCRAPNARKNMTLRGGKRAASLIETLADKSRTLYALKSIALSGSFEAGMGIVILANSVCIGLESAYSARDQTPPRFLSLLEIVFLGIYACEVLLRFLAYGWPIFKDKWVQFDLFIVVFGLVDFVLTHVGLSMDYSDRVTLIRIGRLVRLVRMVRIFVQFRELWFLVSGLINSLRPILCTVMLMFIFIYVYSIIGVEIIRSDPSAGEEYQAVYEKYFSTLYCVMLTLVQFLVLDSINSIQRPLIVAKPHLILYFGTFILITAIALMNLMTAVMVESSVAQAQKDREEDKMSALRERKNKLPILAKLFKELDRDGKGYVTFAEILAADVDFREQLEHFVSCDQLEEVLQALDFDNSGSLDVDEFCEGILQVSTSGKPIELKRIMQQCNEIRRVAADVQSSQRQLIAWAARGNGDVHKEI